MPRINTAPPKAFDAGFSLLSSVSVCEWVCAPTRLCERRISETNEGNFTQFWSQMYFTWVHRCADYRSPDIGIVVDGLRFYHDSSSIFFFFVSYPPSSLNGTQPKLTTCLEVSMIWKCMSEIWKPSPINRMHWKVAHFTCHLSLTQGRPKLWVSDAPNLNFWSVQTPTHNGCVVFYLVGRVHCRYPGISKSWRLWRQAALRDHLQRLSLHRWTFQSCIFKVGYSVHAHAVIELTGTIASLWTCKWCRLEISRIVYVYRN